MNSKMTVTLVSHGGVDVAVITCSLAASGSNDLTFAVGSTYLMLHFPGLMPETMPLGHTKTGGATITLSNDFDTAATSLVLAWGCSSSLFTTYWALWVMEVRPNMPLIKQGQLMLRSAAEELWRLC